MKTIFCDIDGTIVKHRGSLDQIVNHPCELLPGVLQRFKEYADVEDEEDGDEPDPAETAGG